MHDVSGAVGFAVFRPKLYRNPSCVPLTGVKNIALKFRTKTSINILQEDLSMIHFWFCLEDTYD